MSIKNLPVYLALASAVACGPNAPRSEAPTKSAEPRQAPYVDVIRNNITERTYPTHACLIDATQDSHIFYCDLKFNGKGLDSVSRVHLVRPTSRDTANYNGRDRWVDGTTSYTADAFPDGFNLDDIVAVMREPLERNSPEFIALERDYALARERFNETGVQK